MKIELTCENSTLFSMFHSDFVTDCYNTFDLDKTLNVYLLPLEDMKEDIKDMQKYGMKNDGVFYMDREYNTIMIPLDDKSGYANIYAIVASTAYAISRELSDLGKGMLPRICADRISLAVNKYIDSTCTTEEAKREYLMEFN